MNTFLQKSWDGILSPLLKRPAAVQLGALCWRDGKTGPEVLLVTSSNKRWILPKGWPIDGMTGSETALQEAWEEAGVKKTKGRPEPLGSYECTKRLDNGTDIQCRIAIYAVEVTKTAKIYPEVDRRSRRWVPIAKAQKLVADEGLRQILAAFAG